MKKILTLAAAAAVLYSCGNNENRYVVEGNLEGINETVYLFDRQQQLLDSAKVENGAFRIEGVAEAPASAILTDARDMRGTFGVMLILEPGTITVARSEQEQNALFATGTVSNDANTAYMTAGSELIREFRDPETTDERREAIEEEYEELGSQALEQNRNNYFGVVMLSQQAYGLSGQEILDEIALFPAELQQTGEMTKIRENAEQKLKTRGTALYRRRTARRRRQGGVAQIRRREPGDEIRPARLLGFVVRSLHGRGSPPEEDLRGVPR